MRGFTQHHFKRNSSNSIFAGFFPWHMKNGAGFTLIEALVTIFVFTLISGAVFGFILRFYKNYAYVFHQSMAINEARRGIETMMKEIREARQGDDGSFAIELADDKEFIFYSDIDEDEGTERVRYFLGGAHTGQLSEECSTFIKGGYCSVSFSNFLSGALESAEIKVSVEGDFGWSKKEYADVFLEGRLLGKICYEGCTDCAGLWQGEQTFDVSQEAADNLLEFTIDATSQVDPACDWQEPNHSMKARFELSFAETIPGQEGQLKKSIINPTEPPIRYPVEQEEIVFLSSYVRNLPPVFEYFDETGAKILDYPARLKDTKLMKVFLVVDVDETRDPPPFELESWVTLRNLKP